MAFYVSGKSSFLLAFTWSSYSTFYCFEILRWGWKSCDVYCGLDVGWWFYECLFFIQCYTDIIYWSTGKKWTQIIGNILETLCFTILKLNCFGEKRKIYRLIDSKSFDECDVDIMCVFEHEIIIWIFYRNQ